MRAPVADKGNEIARKLHIKGRVQAVGFRPFIYRLANQLGLAGKVHNQPDGVIVHLEGSIELCDKFVEELPKQAPPAAIIKEINIELVPYEQLEEFLIIPSQKTPEIIAEICPDIAICKDCLKELYSINRRQGYPFINCTNCGPRFTLIEDFPYDRKYTSMREFDMCPECSHEYTHPGDRRFHAQPVSCFQCGPEYALHVKSTTLTDFSFILNELGKQINEGLIVALKGLGGYNLACDAFNESAVNELRNFKKRERKPFAIMFRSIENLKQSIEINRKEEHSLLSWRRPIVILNGKIRNQPAEGINCGLNSLGAFLPYLPLHYLLFDQLKTDAIVLTSGNESDTPILYQDDQALKTFAGISGGILVNNRRIARRADDSVVRVICDEPRILRRSRGYAPAPVDLHFDVEGVLATGAELSNTFCLGKKNQAILSQHIGDLQNYETYEFFHENIIKFSNIYRLSPNKIACDMHPDYLSSKYARESGIPVIEVQHHHAHIASVMAEYKIEDAVIGVTYDGTGYGTDGHIWGSEVMIADYRDFKRISHYEYIPLPGGDKVTKEPWRTGLSYLYSIYGREWSDLKIPFCHKIRTEKAERVIEAIDKGINSPLSCSTGRLFDATAAILCICTESNYHAEAPQLLENYLDNTISEAYDFSGSGLISFAPMIREIVSDIHNNTPMEIIVSKFHNTIACAALGQVRLANSESGIKKVVLSGGSFQNKYLTEKLVHLLQQDNFEVFLPGEVSCNDGGIALGQLAIAAHKTE